MIGTAARKKYLLQKEKERKKKTKKNVNRMKCEAVMHYRREHLTCVSSGADCGGLAKAFSFIFIPGLVLVMV